MVCTLRPLPPLALDRVDRIPLMAAAADRQPILAHYQPESPISKLDPVIFGHNDHS